MRVQLVDEEQQRAVSRNSVFVHGVVEDDEWNEEQWEAEQADLEFNSVLKMIGEECLMSLMAGPTRAPMKRCFFNCLNLLGIIIFKAVVLYLFKLEPAPEDSKAAFIHHLQNVMPFIGAFMPIVLVLDSALFQTSRCGLIYLLMGLFGILLVVFQIVSWTATYLCVPAFVDAMSNLVHGALLIIFKSRWPFRKRKNA